MKELNWFRLLTWFVNWQVNIDSGVLLVMRFNSWTPLSWVEAASLFISQQSLYYTQMMTWIYVICVKTIVVYYQPLMNNRHQFFLSPDWPAIGRHFGHLNQTVRSLHDGMSLILLVNWCNLMINVIQSIYYVVRYAPYAIWTYTSWDFFCLAELVGRSILICQSADSLRSCVCYKEAYIYRYSKYLHYVIIGWIENGQRRSSP